MDAVLPPDDNRSSDETSGTTETVLLLPLVITQVDETYGCVTGVTPDGRLLRPEPTMMDDIAGNQAYYRFGDVVHCRLGPTQSSEPRPEDRSLLRRLPVSGDVTEWHGDARESWFAAHCDPSVEAAFSGDRSVGLVRARAESLKQIRSTRGRFLILLGFTDEDEQYHQWVVPDLPFSQLMTAVLRDADDAEGLARQVVECLSETNLFLAVVLSRPRPNSLGSIRGCQPLVGGVHSFPPYREILTERVPAIGSALAAASGV